MAIITEAPLKACQIIDGGPKPAEFYLGFGEVPIPWGFSHAGTGDTVGFFKIFFTTSNAGHSPLVQKSPFDHPEVRVGGLWKENELKWWATRRQTVLQRSP